ncbi:MAG TPA: DUF1592 domain-containing protein [Polyangiaceae bacterium]
MSCRRLDTRWRGLLALCFLAVACGRSSRNAGDAGPGGATAGRAHSGGGEAGAVTGVDAGSGNDGGKDSVNAAGAGGSIDEPDLSSVVLDGTPLYTRVPRLTPSQWEHAVTDILRFAQARDLSRGFLRPASGVTDFDNNEKLLYVDATNLPDFVTGAEAAAALATESADALAALYEGTDAAGFVRTLGRRAFRRPLTAAEEAAYGAIFARGEELYGAGFASGAALVIRALLQSPHFLYRTELGPAGEALSGYEVASKLSFWLLDTTPSDALLDSAAAGELDGEQGLEAAARQMLEAPAAVAVLNDFHRQLLALDDALALDKSGVPDWDPSVLPELDAASSAFFDRIFQADLGLRELLTSNEAYVGPGLAAYYGLSVTANGLELRELGPSRSGYFLQVPFLMVRADGARSDPIQRGFRLQRLVCGELPAAHAAPPETPLPIDGQTTREAVAALTTTCGGPCHQAMEPLGFAFENFDGLGRERDTDNGQPVDTASSFPFAEGVRQFADGTELVRTMAESLQVHTCYSKSVTGYALGRDVAPSDRPLLEALGEVSLMHSLKEVVIALVREPAFRSRPEAAP